ncbi:MAG: ATP-dependent DNA helicase RecG [Xanthomonadales bacterium]|nr:ATP-dependent DNA helicase RecG [Xanthomonadales bacterium]
MTDQPQLSDSVRILRGVGPGMQEGLKKLGIESVADLLFHLPMRYEDRSQTKSIGDCRPGDRVLVEGFIQNSNIVRHRRAMLVVTLSDDTGSLSLRFFNFHAAQIRSLSRGVKLQAFGEIRGGARGLEMIHPSYQKSKNAEEEASLTPIYPSTEGIRQASWINLSEQALKILREDTSVLTELLPAALLLRQQLPELKTALLMLHRPDIDSELANMNRMDENFHHPARDRLVIEELLAHHLSMRRIQQQQQRRKALAFPLNPTLEDRFLQQLPFQLTRAQQRVITEIQQDLNRQQPMMRLLQGDVGCGKTVVAALSLLPVVAAGYQVAITAPTELLAEQHRDYFAQTLKPLGIDTVWLSSRVTGKAREQALHAIANGVAVVIGTHSLMQKTVEFKQLGLVIIDEQHRFGVHQRLALREKGQAGGHWPHQLIMTATPIPRTLAMTAYAGLQISVIDELPPGRTAVTTVAIDQQRREQVIERIAFACREGRQAYWVCTLIEESELLEAQAAEDTARQLSAELPDINIALVHGRMKPAEKSAIMTAFRNAEIKLLVATTVIEVGVDVPNASLMVIDNAERLGLSQLHQLRGRVGRGSEKSSCVLLFKPPLGETARARLDIMRATNDGFRIAEKDLELRGPGEVLGTRQTGALQFRLADLARDAALIQQVPQLAEALLNDHHRTDALIARWLGNAERYAEA